MFKRKRINFHPLEFEEIFLDNFLKKREKSIEVLDRKIETPLQGRIFTLFLFAAFFCFFLALAAVFNLSVVHQSKYKQLALANKFLTLRIKAERGIIYDHTMNQLVFNEPRFRLIFDKDKEVANGEISVIADILKKGKAEIKEKIESSEDSLITIAENLSLPQYIALEARKSSFSAFAVEKVIKRKYLTGAALSHLLGYIGKISKKELKEFKGRRYITDYVGKEGLEKEYEEILAEKKGLLKVERTAKGEPLAEFIEKEPQPGGSLILNLDLGLQTKIKQTLADIVEKGVGSSAAAVAINPQNGAVLAAVSLPDFDNNIFSQGINPAELKKLNYSSKKPQLNRVIGGTYPVGSTIKPLISAAALEEGIITEKTRLFCPKSLCLKNKYSGELKCFGDWKFHGWTDVKKAIAESVNPFFYIIGGGYKAPPSADKRVVKQFKGLGVEKINEWLKAFGWGAKTGIDLPGEVEGRIPSPEWKKEHFAKAGAAAQKWYQGDTFNLSIGQGYIAVTPIQVATAFQAIANGKGVIFQPQIVKKIISNGKEETFKPKPIKKVPLKENSIRIVREGMRLAVLSLAGSCYSLSSLPVSVAAKTGTAQTPKRHTYNNWITLFAPYEKPELLLVIVVENVKGIRRVVQPAAYKILQWYFSRKPINKYIK